MKKSIGAQTLLYPNPVLLIGTYDADSKPNLMNAAWGGICCSNPPCIAVGIRPERKTLANIKLTGAFTVSTPTAATVKEADYVGLYSGNSVDKFAVTGLTAVPSAVVTAPIIEEFPFVMECALKQMVVLGSHVLVIGEIRDIKVDEVAVDANGEINTALLKPLLYDHGEAVYRTFGEKVADAFSVGKELVK